MIMIIMIKINNVQKLPRTVIEHVKIIIISFLCEIVHCISHARYVLWAVNAVRIKPKKIVIKCQHGLLFLEYT